MLRLAPALPLGRLGPDRAQVPVEHRAIALDHEAIVTLEATAERVGEPGAGAGGQGVGRLHVAVSVVPVEGTAAEPPQDLRPSARFRLLSPLRGAGRPGGSLSLIVAPQARRRNGVRRDRNSLSGIWEETARRMVEGAAGLLPGRVLTSRTTRDDELPVGRPHGARGDDGSIAVHAAGNLRGGHRKPRTEVTIPNHLLMPNRLESSA